MKRKGSLLALRDREIGVPSPTPENSITDHLQSEQHSVAPSRRGKKAITGYFSPALSFSMHMTARKHGLSLQDAMGEAFNDWLRKMGESPVGM